MESNTVFIYAADRYMFDETLTRRGYHQLDSEQDASYFGTWFKPEDLEMIEFAEGDVTTIKFESSAEFIGQVLAKKDVMAYTHIDDWDNSWVVPIERGELELYMSYMRNDAMQ